MKLSVEDVEYMLQEKLALRHVSSREHLASHFTGKQLGDAVPLSGMKEVIMGQLIDEGIAQPRDRWSPVKSIMEKYGPILRDRIEQGIKDIVQASVNMDGLDRYSNAQVHFMVVKGMTNADSPSMESGYAFGKCGRQDIFPSQIVSSFGINTDDLAGALSAGKTVTEVLTGKVGDAIRGMRTGDAGLVADLRNTGDSVLSAVVPNSILYNNVDPVNDKNFRNADSGKGATLAAWSMEATYATVTPPTASDLQRINKVADAAIKADPLFVMSGSAGLLGSQQGAALQNAAAGWVEKAFGEMVVKDPQGAMIRMAVLAERLPEGHPHLPMAIRLYEKGFDALYARDPSLAKQDLGFRAGIIKPESSLGRFIAEKSAKPPSPPVSLKRDTRVSMHLKR